MSSVQKGIRDMTQTEKLIREIAKAYDVDATELKGWVDGRGWDFSSLDWSSEEQVKCVTSVITNYAEGIAAHAAKNSSS